MRRRRIERRSPGTATSGGKPAHHLCRMEVRCVPMHAATRALVAAALLAGAPVERADRAIPRTDRNSMTAHAELLEKRTRGRIDVYFVGDSITRRWGALDYPDLLAHWKANFYGWNAADFGWGADKIQNILWRLEHGELDGVHPKIVVILAGTNNIGSSPGDASKVADITRGMKALVDICRRKAPRATIVLMAIFPRNDNMAVMPEIDRVNANLRRFADGTTIRFLDVNDRLADADGRLFDGIMNERDRPHPTLKGYQVWADGFKPIFTEILGPPAAIDEGPPPTGDPSARRPTPNSVRIQSRLVVQDPHCELQLAFRFPMDLCSI